MRAGERARVLLFASQPRAHYSTESPLGAFVFELLQHPPQSPERVPLGAGVSLAVHAALVLSMVSGARHMLEPSHATHETVITAAIKYLVPPNRPSPAPQEAAVRFGGPRGEEQAPPTQYVKPEEKLPLLGEMNLPKEDRRTALPLAVEAVAQNAFTLLDVDAEATRDPDSAVPIYPRVLELKGIEGSALVRFVVDTTGRADIESFRIVEETHRLFGQAVRDALPRMRFRPAMMGDKKVRQLVEQPFGFRLVTRGMVETGRRP
jgi:protein TonB